MRAGPPFDRSASTSTTRRALLARAGAAAAAAGATGLAGCSLAGADHASYWSESGQIDVDYGAAMTAAREAGYTVDEPYYVGVKEARGIHPGGFPDLDRRFGPGFRVFGFALFHTEHVLVEFWLTGEAPSITLVDDRGVVDAFPMEALPPEAWFVDRLQLAFNVSAADAEGYYAEIREQAAEGTETPRIEVEAPVTFRPVYESILAERTAVVGSGTGGDGWYKETSFLPDRRLATVDFVVQSMEVRRTDDDRTYTLKLDRLGGFYLQARLPAGEELPQAELRSVFRRMFEDLDLPPEVVDGLTFEYSSSVW